MRIRICSIILLLAMLFTIPVYASERSVTIWPGISFDGTKATCSVAVTADQDSDKIDAVMKLWNGSYCIDEWKGSSKGYLILNEETSVAKGRSYTLTVDVTINNVKRPTVSVSGICK